MHIVLEPKHKILIWHERGNYILHNSKIPLRVAYLNIRIFVAFCTYLHTIIVRHI